MSEAEVRERPLPELVQGEMLFWKMAEVRGILIRHLVTGYLVTSYRGFIWDVEANSVRVNVPISLADVTVEGKRMGKRARRGGSFIVPKTADYVPPVMGEPVEIGDLLFRIEDEPIMVFREVAEPLKVKALIDALRAQARTPGVRSVDVLWKSSGESAGHRT
jgi:hypothetical protein